MIAMDANAQIAAIARLETHIEIMTKSIMRLEKLTEDQHKQLTVIESRLSEAQGGMRAILWIGGPLMSAIGAGLMWIAKYWPLGH